MRLASSEIGASARALLAGLLALVLLFSASVARAHSHIHHSVPSFSEAHASCVLCEHATVTAASLPTAELSLWLPPYQEYVQLDGGVVLISVPLTGRSARGPPSER